MRPGLERGPVSASYRLQSTLVLQSRWRSGRLTVPWNASTAEGWASWPWAWEVVLWPMFTSNIYKKLSSIKDGEILVVSKVVFRERGSSN